MNKIIDSDIINKTFIDIIIGVPLVIHRLLSSWPLLMRYEK